MSNNTNLVKAKQVKNDEFYTLYNDIHNEIKNYKDKFKDKIVYCNCDSKKSNFFKYFYDNFDVLGLKKLIITYMDENKPSYKTEVFKVNNQLKILDAKLKSNGDFKSNECIKILKHSDVIVTNPPFSEFKNFIKVIIDNNKEFLVIGNRNAFTTTYIFGLYKDNKIGRGYTKPTGFITPTGEITKRVNGLSMWFQNLKESHFKELELTKRFYDNIYPKYENIEAINVDRLKDIPYDYYGAMGVPITYLDYHNPKFFKILGMDVDLSSDKSRSIVNGKKKYARVIIQRVD